MREKPSMSTPSTLPTERAISIDPCRTSAASRAHRRASQRGGRVSAKEGCVQGAQQSSNQHFVDSCLSLFHAAHSLDLLCCDDHGLVVWYGALACLLLGKHAHPPVASQPQLRGRPVLEIELQRRKGWLEKQGRLAPPMVIIHIAPCRRGSCTVSAATRRASCRRPRGGMC